MLIDRYEALLNGEVVIDDSNALLSDRIDSRKSYFKRLAGGGKSKSKSYRGGSYRHGNLRSNKPISQRVLVKIHYKKHGVGGASAGAGAGNLRGHLSYITRSGAGVDEQRPVLFGSEGVELARSDFYNVCKDDRHHFRIIISPENAHEIVDMERYVCGVMRDAERDLDTKLQWVSAIHYDTDNPHAHVIVRGRDELNRDLVIAPDYISNGFRMRAQELATEILGERSLEDIQRAMESETDRMGVTSLDRFIEGRASQAEKEAGEIVVDTNVKGFSGRGAFYDGLVQRRLEFLTTTAMAVQEPKGVFKVRYGFAAELKEIGERNDIIKQLHRVLPQESQGVLIYDASLDDAQVVRGRVEKIAFVNELTDHKYMVVRDGLERAHYVALMNNGRSDELLEGQIVEVSSGKSKGGADANIALIASENGGVYTRDAHVEYVEREMSYIEDVEAYVDAHGVRLETLKKSKIVEHNEVGFVVPNDVEAQGAALNKELEKAGWKKKSYARVKEISKKPIASQIEASARTFLDLEIYRQQKGYGLSYGRADKATIDALHKRMDWLAEHGFGRYREDDGQFVMSGDALGKLYAIEKQAAGVDLYNKYGKGITKLDVSSKQVARYFGYVELHSGKHLIVEKGGELALIKSNLNAAGWHKTEKLILEQGEKGIKISRSIQDKNKEAAIERLVEKYGMENKDLDVKIGDKEKGVLIGNVTLKEGLFLAVEHDNKIALVEVDEFGKASRGDELEFTANELGVVSVQKPAPQLELSLEARESKKDLDKDIDIDW